MDIDSSNVVSNNVIGSNSQVSITQNIVHAQTSDINPIPHQLPLAPDLFDRVDIRDSRLSRALIAVARFASTNLKSTAKSSW